MAWITSDSVSVSLGSKTVLVTGSVDLSPCEEGWGAQIAGNAIVECSSGTAPDSGGNSTLTLVKPWIYETVSSVSMSIIPNSGYQITLAQRIKTLTDRTVGVMQLQHDYTSQLGQVVATDPNTGERLVYNTLRQNQQEIDQTLSIITNEALGSAAAAEASAQAAALSAIGLSDAVSAADASAQAAAGSVQVVVDLASQSADSATASQASAQAAVLSETASADSATASQASAQAAALSETAAADFAAASQASVATISYTTTQFDITNPLSSFDQSQDATKAISGVWKFGSVDGSAKWSGGVLAPSGKIYGIPYGSTQVLEIDPVTQTTTLFGSLNGSLKYRGGVLAPSGKIYGIPYGSTQVLEIAKGSAGGNYWALSAYVNKF